MFATGRAWPRRALAPAAAALLFGCPRPRADAPCAHQPRRRRRSAPCLNGQIAGVGPLLCDAVNATALSDLFRSSP